MNSEMQKMIDEELVKQKIQAEILERANKYPGVNPMPTARDEKRARDRKEYLMLMEEQKRLRKDTNKYLGK